MAVSGSREVDIEAPPADVLAVIADLEGLPAWSSIHKKVSVRERDDAGRPLVAEMTVAVMGITDEQVLEFTWTDTFVSWKVVESTQQKSQTARYDLTETDRGTHLTFEITLDPKIPVPGFIVKRGTKTVLETATDGLRQQVVG